MATWTEVGLRLNPDDPAQGLLGGTAILGNPWIEEWLQARGADNLLKRNFSDFVPEQPEILKGATGLFDSLGKKPKKIFSEGGDDAGGSPPDPNKGFVGPGPSAAVDVKSQIDTFSGIPGDPFGLGGLMTPSVLANLAFGFTPLGIPNSISGLLGGPTFGGLLESFLDSQTAVGKALSAVDDATMGGSALGNNPEDLYQRGMITDLSGKEMGLNNPFAAAQELGLDYSGTDQPSVDVQTQVDTFSTINDQTMDAGDDDDGAFSDPDDNVTGGYAF